MKKILLLSLILILFVGCSKKPKTDEQNNTIEVKKAKELITNHYYATSKGNKNGYYFLEEGYIYYYDRKLKSKKEKVIERGNWSIENDALLLKPIDLVEAVKNEKDEYEFVVKIAHNNRDFKIIEVNDKSLKLDSRDFINITDELTEERKKYYTLYIKSGFDNFDYEKIK